MHSLNVSFWLLTFSRDPLSSVPGIVLSFPWLPEVSRMFSHVLLFKVSYSFLKLFSNASLTFRVFLSCWVCSEVVSGCCRWKFTGFPWCSEGVSWVFQNFLVFMVYFARFHQCSQGFLALFGGFFYVFYTCMPRMCLTCVLYVLYICL